MPWLSADDVFEAQDREDEASQPSPWLHRRRGPLRKPDEGKYEIRAGLDERVQLVATKIREAEEALAAAGPDADLSQRRKRLAQFRTKCAILLHGRR
jgi:hypothetical protein